MIVMTQTSFSTGHLYRCFEDKLDSMNVLIYSLGMTGADVTKSFGQCFVVLQHLGVSFPSAVDDQCIGGELIEIRKCLTQVLPASVSDFQIMEDSQKVNAMVGFS